jgi:sec-independent protein translocase protein TatA
MFGSIGMPELILIFVVALLVFGPRKLPEIGKSLGRGLAEFKRASDDLKKTIEREIEEAKTEVSTVGHEVSAAANTIARTPSAEPSPGTADPSGREAGPAKPA